MNNDKNGLVETTKINENVIEYTDYKMIFQVISSSII